MGRAVRERGFESAVGRDGRLQSSSLDAEEQREVGLGRGQRAGQRRELGRPRERGGSGGACGLLVGVASLDERDRARDQGHDQQDREADRERPQPAGRSTRGSQLVIVRGVGGIEKLPLERIGLTGMSGGPVERGFEARAR